MSDAYRRVEITSVANWRRWLEGHHASSPGIWLVTWKKGHGPYVAYSDSVDEAICFGWVDGRAGSVDANRTRRLLTPRRVSSSWSRVNKERVDRLTQLGRMAPAGVAAVEAAKANGSWAALDQVERLAEPADLAAALNANQAARGHWDTFPRSAKRAILEWISAAKTEPTRGRRVTESVDEAAQGRRANQWRQQKLLP